MKKWRKGERKELVIIDIDSLVPADHLIGKENKVMDYEWLYKRLSHIIAITTIDREHIQ